MHVGPAPEQRAVPFFLSSIAACEYCGANFLAKDGMIQSVINETRQRGSTGARESCSAPPAKHNSLVLGPNSPALTT